MNGEVNSKENVHFYSDTYDVHPANFSHFFRGNAAKCNRRIKKKNDNLRSQLLLLNKPAKRKKMLNGLFT